MLTLIIQMCVKYRVYNLIVKSGIAFLQKNTKLRHRHEVSVSPQTTHIT